MPVTTMTFETRRFGQRPIVTDVDLDWRWAGGLPCAARSRSEPIRENQLNKTGNPVGVKSLISDLGHFLGHLSHSHSPARIVSGGAWLDDHQVCILSNGDRTELLVFAQVDRPLQRGDLDRLRTRKTGLHWQFGFAPITESGQRVSRARGIGAGEQPPSAAKARSSSRRTTHPQCAETNGVACAPIEGRPLNRTSASRRRVSCPSTGR